MIVRSPFVLERIFDKFLAQIHARALSEAGVPLLIKVRPEARDLILDRGTDVRFGARPLRRAMEAELLDPLSRLIASQRVEAGDVIEVELLNGQLAFFRSRETPSSVVV